MSLEWLSLSNWTVSAGGVASSISPFMLGFIVFVLACFVGYHVIWNVTPALHTPLMAVTNAISGIIIVGALLIITQEVADWIGELGFIGVLIASVNVFGGFVVTQRMLAMFKKQKR